MSKSPRFTNGWGRGFAALQVGTLGLDHRSGHTQPDHAVDRSAAPGDLPVAVLDGDLVAEEPRRAGTRVRYQGFLLAQFQSEVIPEELGQALFDLFGLGPWSDEPSK